MTDDLHRWLEDKFKMVDLRLDSQAQDIKEIKDNQAKFMRHLTVVQVLKAVFITIGTVLFGILTLNWVKVMNALHTFTSLYK